METIKVSALDKSTLHLMYKEHGQRPSDIAAVFGVAPKRVTEVLHALYGTFLPSQGARSKASFCLSEEASLLGPTEGFILKHYEAGLNPRQIRDAFGPGATTDQIVGRLKKMGLPPSRKKAGVIDGRESCKLEHAQPAKVIEDALGLTRAELDARYGKEWLAYLATRLSSREELQGRVPQYRRGQKGLAPSQGLDAILVLREQGSGSAEKQTRRMWDDTVPALPYPSYALESFFGTWGAFTMLAGVTPSREYQGSKAILKDFFLGCQQKGAWISPHEYGMLRSGEKDNPFKQRAARLLSATKGRYRYLLAEAQRVCLDPQATQQFLDRYFPE